MTTSKVALYQTPHIRLCERMAKEDLGLSEDELMARAGFIAFTTLEKLYPAVRTIAVFCGGGNNAGDGYVLARLAKTKGYTVIVNQYKTIENLPAAAQHAALQALAIGVVCQSIDEPIDSDAELIIDALLGIGLKGPVQGPLATAITQINDSGLPVLAIDVPSGLEADTGAVLGVCVHAVATVTFIGYKLGLLTLDGPDHCGEIICHNLQLDKCLANITPAAYLLDDSLLSLLPKGLKN